MSLRFCSCGQPGAGRRRAGRRGRRWRVGSTLCLGLLLLLDAGVAVSQQTRLRPVRRSYARPTLIVTGGVAEPLSHESLTDFWLRGPAASVAFTLDVQRWLALGIEFGGAQFYFDRAAFGLKYPGVPIEAQNAGMIDAHLLAKFMFDPRMIFSPYLTGTLGATHWTGASYKEELPGQPRRIFYDIPRKTRLAAGLTLGADIVLSSWFAVVVEARASTVINDPDLGLTAALRGGVRLRL